MGKKKQDAKAADDDAVLLAAQRRPPSLALFAAALVACCGVAFEVGRRSAACEACAACPEPVAAAPSDAKSCPPCKEKKKGRKEKAPRAWVTDDEAVALELCSSQDDNHRCAPALADGVPDALTDGATFNKFARAGVPWVARNTTLAGPTAVGRDVHNAIGEQTKLLAGSTRVRASCQILRHKGEDLVKTWQAAERRPRRRVESNIRRLAPSLAPPGHYV